MTELKMVAAKREHGERMDEEIAWLRSFGWNNQRIAQRLGVSVACIVKRDARRA